MIKVPSKWLSGLLVCCEDIILRVKASFENCAAISWFMCLLLKSTLYFCTVLIDKGFLPFFFAANSLNHKWFLCFINFQPQFQRTFAECAGCGEEKALWCEPGDDPVTLFMTVSLSVIRSILSFLMQTWRRLWCLCHDNLTTVSNSQQVTLVTSNATRPCHLGKVNVFPVVKLALWHFVTS